MVLYYFLLVKSFKSFCNKFKTSRIVLWKMTSEMFLICFSKKKLLNVLLVKKVTMKNYENHVSGNALKDNISFAWITRRNLPD